LTEAGASIEREGIRRASVAIETADLLLVVCQPSTLNQLEAFRHSLPIPDQTLVVEVLNKADLIGEEPSSTAKTIEHQTIASSEEDPGVAKLMETLASHLVSTLPPRCSPVPICKRQLDLAEQLCVAHSLSDANTKLRQLLTGVAP
ncbi:MAG: tRNA modification GTPase, partial [Rhodopirellula bahusiensis]